MLRANNFHFWNIWGPSEANLKDLCLFYASGLWAGDKWKPMNIYTQRTDSVIWKMALETRRQLDSWSLRDDKGLTSGSCWGGSQEGREEWRQGPWNTWWLLAVGMRMWCFHRWHLRGYETVNGIEESVTGATVMCLQGNDSVLLFTIYFIPAFVHLLYISGMHYLQ